MRNREYYNFYDNDEDALFEYGECIVEWWKIFRFYDKLWDGK